MAEILLAILNVGLAVACLYRIHKCKAVLSATLSRLKDKDGVDVGDRKINT